MNTANAHAIAAAAKVASIARSHRSADGLPVIVTLSAVGGGESALMLTDPRHAAQHLTANNPALIAAVKWITAEPGRRARLAP